MSYPHIPRQTDTLGQESQASWISFWPQGPLTSRDLGLICFFSELSLLSHLFTMNLNMNKILNIYIKPRLYRSIRMAGLSAFSLLPDFVKQKSVEPGIKIISVLVVPAMPTWRLSPDGHRSKGGPLHWRWWQQACHCVESWILFFCELQRKGLSASTCVTWIQDFAVVFVTFHLACLGAHLQPADFACGPSVHDVWNHFPSRLRPSANLISIPAIAQPGHRPRCWPGEIFAEVILRARVHPPF